MPARLKEETMEGRQEKIEKPRPTSIRCELNNSNKDVYCLEMWKIGKMLSGELLFIPWLERVLENDPVASKRRCWVNCGYYQDFRQRYEN